MFCPKCGHKELDENITCSNCGNYLKDPIKKETNGFAIVGLCFAWFPPLGLLYSIIGINKARFMNGNGLVLSIIDLFVNIAWLVGIFHLLIYTFHVL